MRAGGFRFDTPAEATRGISWLITHTLDEARPEPRSAVAEGQTNRKHLQKVYRKPFRRLGGREGTRGRQQECRKKGAQRDAGGGVSLLCVSTMPCVASALSCPPSPAPPWLSRRLSQVRRASRDHHTPSCVRVRSSQLRLLEAVRLLTPRSHQSCGTPMFSPRPGEHWTVLVGVGGPGSWRRGGRRLLLHGEGLGEERRIPSAFCGRWGFWRV